MQRHPLEVWCWGFSLGQARKESGWTYTPALMPIDIDIAHVARLARLDLTPEELEGYRNQLGIILEHAARVQAADTDDLEPTAHPLGLTNAYRADEVTTRIDRGEVLAAAPAARDGYFLVPPALDNP